VRESQRAKILDLEFIRGMSLEIGERDLGLRWSDSFFLGGDSDNGDEMMIILERPYKWTSDQLLVKLTSSIILVKHPITHHNFILQCAALPRIPPIRAANLLPNECTRERAPERYF
jgi:hypothetical protein